MILSYRSLLPPPPTVAPIYTTRICDGHWRLYKEIMRWRLYTQQEYAMAAGAYRRTIGTVSTIIGLISS